MITTIQVKEHPELSDKKNYFETKLIIGMSVETVLKNCNIEKAALITCNGQQCTADFIVMQESVIKVVDRLAKGG